MKDRQKNAVFARKQIFLLYIMAYVLKHYSVEKAIFWSVNTSFSLTQLYIEQIITTNAAFSLSIKFTDDTIIAFYSISYLIPICYLQNHNSQILTKTKSTVTTKPHDEYVTCMKKI